MRALDFLARQKGCYGPKSMFKRIFILFLFLAALASAGLFLLVRNDEVWARRVSAVPLYARTYLHSLQPTPALPTPPPVAADSRQRLLAARATLAPPVISVENSLPATFTPRPDAPTPTLLPSPTPTRAATATPPLSPVATRVALGGIQHAYQLWNNCGPVTIAMNLSYYGIWPDQREVAAELKPNQDDKNVSPEQLAAYAASQGFASTVRVGGTVTLLQRLLSNGFPVIVEDWVEPEDRGGIGHYRLFTGYDTAEGVFFSHDSLYGPNRQVPMDGFDATWRVFNRKYIVVYRPQEEEKVKLALGAAADDEAMLAQALAVAQQEAQADANDPFAWFNLGSTYTLMDEPALAASAFDEARRLGLPMRMLWYQLEIFEAYLGAGRYQDVVELGEATAQTTQGHEEVYYYLGVANAAQDKQDVAVSYWRKALEYNPNYAPAARKLQQLGQ